MELSSYSLKEEIDMSKGPGHFDTKKKNEIKYKIRQI